MTALELALKKQHLVYEAEAQREALARHVAGMQPIFATADRVHVGARWLRQHPEAVALALVALLATRPGGRRLLWRWARRGLLAWQFWGEADRWIGPLYARFGRG